MRNKRQKSAGKAREWDCSKVVSRITRSLSSQSDDCVFLVLVLSGALNPVHRGHTEMLRHSKKLLEQSSLDGRSVVVAGYALAPSSESYVKRKLGAHAISLSDRVLMCEAAAHSEELTCVVPFGIANALHTAAEMRPCLERRLRIAMDHLESPVCFDPKHDVHILPVYGSDFLVRCPQAARQPTLITFRQDEEDTAERAEQIVASETKLHPSFRLLKVESGAIPDFSSTAIREATGMGSNFGVHYPHTGESNGKIEWTIKGKGYVECTFASFREIWLMRF